MLKSICVLGLTLLFSADLSAQINNGRILGTALDPTGAVIVGATVTATNASTGIAVTTNTHDAGVYGFPDLPAGTYTIRIEMAGFRPVVTKNVVLDAAGTRTVDFSLQPGASDQTVEVTTTDQQVNITSSELSNTLEGKRIENLQLNGRNYIQLVTQTPGAISTNLDPFSAATGTSSGNVTTVNGIRGASVYTQVDSLGLQDPENDAAAVATPGIDTIAETRVLTADYAPEYFSHGGAVVNVITKTGTRTFHGSVFEFLRNNDFDAKSAFALIREPLHFNDFGFTLGGPIYVPRVTSAANAKFFFFVGEEFKRIITATAALNIVPTAAQLNGIFPQVTATGAVGPKVYQPGTKTPYTTCPQNPALANTGYCVPNTAFSPNGVALLSIYQNTPVNYSVPGVASNYSTNPISRFNVREDRVNLDFDATSKSTYSLKYDHTDALQFLPLFAIFPNEADQYPRISNFALFDFTHAFSDSLVNDLSVGLVEAQFFNNVDTKPPFTRAGTGTTYPQVYGNNPLGLNPTLQITGYTGLTIQAGAEHEVHTLSVHDDVSKVVNKHTLKFGVFTGYSTDYENKVTAANVNGLVSFTGSATVPKTTSNALGDALVGNFATYQETQFSTAYSSRYNIADGFIQDYWKATPRLTLNYGVRYTFPQQNYNTYNAMSTFIPSSFSAAAAPTVSTTNGALSGTYNPYNGLALPGSGFPGSAAKTVPAASNPALAPLFSNLPRGFAPTPKADLAPRFGFALDVFGNGKTSIRGGYGIFFDRPTHFILQIASLNPPFNTTANITNGSIDNPVGGGVSNFPSSLYALPLHYTSPYIQAFNLNVQHQLPLQLIGQVAYVGTLGRHLERVLNLNQLQPGTLQAHPGVNQNALRPYPGYSDIDALTWEDTTNYHAVQASLTRRVRGGFTFNANFTFSKMIESASNPTNFGLGALPENSYNPRAEYGIADLDRPKVFNANGVWAIPFFLHSGKALRYTVGGWTLSGVLSMQSGTPVNVVLGTENEGIGSSVALTGTGTVTPPAERANLTGSPRLAPNTRTVAHWFNTAAYTTPTAGTVGNAGRNALRGPGYTQTDLSTHKDFTVEAVTLQFRAEAFNIWNHTNYTTVGSTLGSATFGQLTASTPGRVLQLALKLSF